VAAGSHSNHSILAGNGNLGLSSDLPHANFPIRTLGLHSPRSLPPIPQTTSPYSNSFHYYYRSSTVARQTNMPFLHLPNEIILQIAGELTPPNLNALLKASRHLAILLSPSLLDSVCRKHYKPYGKRALYFAAEREDKATVRRLIDRGLLKVVGEGALLNEAVLDQSEKVISTLLACGVGADTKNAKGRTPLSLAARYGRAGVVRLLLREPAIDVNSVDKTNSTPLLLAATRGHEEVVRLLLNDKRVEVDTQDKRNGTPLHRALFWGQEAVVRLLIEDQRSDINLQNIGNPTPLHSAAFWGYSPVVRQLLADPRINVNPTNYDDWTPLHTAADQTHECVARALLEDPRVAINHNSSSNGTPLHVAAMRGCAAVVELLLRDPRVQVNLRDPNGDTALHLAANQEHEQIVLLLLAHKDISVNIPNNSGCSVKNLAHVPSQYSPKIQERILGHDPKEKANVECLGKMY